MTIKRHRTPQAPTAPAATASASSRMARIRVRRRERGGLAGKHTHLVLLTCVWVALWGRLSVVSVASGLLLALVITLAFPMPHISWPGRVHPLGLLALVAHLLVDLARASCHLALFALDMRRSPHSGIVGVHMRANADLYQVATSTILSIVPGSLVVDARGRSRMIYLHVFDMDASQAEVRRSEARDAERRILRAFGSAEDHQMLSRSVSQPLAPSAPGNMMEDPDLTPGPLQHPGRESGNMTRIDAQVGETRS